MVYVHVLLSFYLTLIRLHKDQQIHPFWAFGPNLCSAVFNLGIWEKYKISVTLTWWVLLSWIILKGRSRLELKPHDWNVIFLGCALLEGNLDPLHFELILRELELQLCCRNTDPTSMLVIFLFCLLHLGWLRTSVIVLHMSDDKKTFLCHIHVKHVEDVYCPQAVTVIMYHMAKNPPETGISSKIWSLWQCMSPSNPVLITYVCIYKLLPNFIWMFKRLFVLKLVLI